MVTKKNNKKVVVKLFDKFAAFLISSFFPICAIFCNSYRFTKTENNKNNNNNNNKMKKEKESCKDDKRKV